MGYDEEECAICYSASCGNTDVGSSNEHMPICFLCMHEHLTDGFRGRMSSYLLTSDRYTSGERCVMCHERRHMLMRLPICDGCIPPPPNNVDSDSDSDSDGYF